MHSPRRTLKQWTTLASVVLVASALAPGAWAASSTTPTTTTTASSAPSSVTTTRAPTTAAPGERSRSWTQVTESDGRNIDEVGVVRTDDGALHVLWRARVGPTQEEIRHTVVSADGEVGEPTTASGGWAAAGNPAAIVTADGGVRIFFGGLTGSVAARDGVQSASADASGATWATEPARVSSTTSAVPEGVGAALRQDGTPAFTYAYSFALGLHFGLSSADPDTDLRSEVACCDYLPNLAFSDTDSDGYLAWYSNVEGQVGLWVQPVWPTIGAATPVPGSAVDGKSILPTQRTPIAARVGAGGTYVAYCGGYPTCTDVLLWQIGDDEPTTVATGRDIEGVNLAADPDGRLWVMWEDAADGSLNTVRSNEDASEFGAVVAFQGPPDANTVWKLQGNASSELLDVFASMTTPGSLATWHTQVLPGLTVETKKSKNSVTFTVSDAGEPVKGAKVAFRKKTVTTDGKGRASRAVGKGAATVTKPGYNPATASVR